MAQSAKTCKEGKQNHQSNSSTKTKLKYQSKSMIEK
jgi:hypothetical protein